MSDGVETEPAPADAAYEAQEWVRAYDLFRESTDPGPRDLERLAWSALWSGRYGEVLDPLERAHRGFADAGDREGEVRTAIGLCQCNRDQNHLAVAKGWLDRAEELLEEMPESTYHGLLAWQRGRDACVAGDLDGHEAMASETLAIGRRIEDRNLQALGMLDVGASKLGRGEIAEGQSLLDRAAALAAAGGLEPATTGLVYCGVIHACRCRGDWPRASEWTALANRWIDRAGIAFFPGLCRTHRSEVLRIQGQLREAEGEVLAAIEILSQASPHLAGFAWAELGEVRRRMGENSGAMEAFKKAIEHAWEPHPGLSRLMLEQGDARSAERALARVLTQPLSTWLREDRANLLSAWTSAAIAAGEMERAEQAAQELQTLSGRTAASADMALAAQAAGEIALARKDWDRAVDHLLVARRLWNELNATYEVGVTQLLLAQGLEGLEDRFGARLQVETARSCMERIGAASMVRQCDDFLARTDPAPRPAIRESPRAATLAQEGDVWSLSLRDRSTRVKDCLGIRYIAALLESPEQEILAADLAVAVRGEEKAAPPSDAGERLDHRAAREYRSRLDELRGELADADSREDAAAVSAIREEMDFLARELSAAFGLGGRARKEGSAAERARQSVTKAIKKAINWVGECDADIGRALATTIKTGTFCSYQPDPETTWTVSRA